MARLPEPRTPALQELARQLRFQPADASRRQLVRAEELALKLLEESEPEREWPVEWVVFRITGYRTEKAAPAFAGTIRGRDLQRDLGALVQILSAAAGERERDLRNDGASRWMTGEELCARWRVTRQTIDRYRALGLFSRRARIDRAEGTRTPPQRALFDRRVIEVFERVHGGMLARAGAFSRTDDRFAERMHRRASRYRRLLGWSLARISQRLAPRTGRSEGAVRRAILDADSRAAEPVFGAGPRLRRAGREQVVQEFNRGGRARDLVRASGRSRASVYRMVAAERARRLRELNLIGPARPEFADDRASERILESPHAAAGLGRPLPHTVAELLEQAQETEPSAARERALGAAYALLRFQAARGIAQLGRSPTILSRGGPRRRASMQADGGIDWIETRLRWATRIKAELVRSQLGLMLRTAESQLGRGLADFPGAVAVDLVGALAAAVFDATDRHDPFKGGRLAAPAGLAMNRAAAKWAEEHPREAGPQAARTLARAAPSHARLDHIWAGSTPWASWLEPPPGTRERIDSVKGRGREVLIARLGWDAHRPRTVLETARALGLTPQAVIRAERAAMRQLL